MMLDNNGIRAQDYQSTWGILEPVVCLVSLFYSMPTSYSWLCKFGMLLKSLSFDWKWNANAKKIQLVVGFGPGPHWQGPGLADLPGYSVLVVGDGWPVCAW
jgi:hypothetical protein